MGPHFENNKWNFTIKAKNKKTIPLYSKILIDIKHNIEDSIAICENNGENTQDIMQLLCESEYETQSENDAIIQILKEKKNGKVEWVQGLDDNVFIKLNSEIKLIVFEKAYNLKINSDGKWEFKIDLSNNELENNAQINLKVDNKEVSSNCVINGGDNKKLTCTIDETATESERIQLINNNLPRSNLIWLNIPEPMDLYVSLQISFINVYGAYHEDKWKFNLRYEKVLSSGKTYKDNYALVDILVNTVSSNEEKIAKCQILETYLYCEFNEIQSNRIQIIGSTTPKSGTISFSESLTSIYVNPLDITIKYIETTITQKAETSKFTITGTLKNTIEYGIISKLNME